MGVQRSMFRESLRRGARRLLDLRHYDAVPRTVRRRFHPQYSFAKFLAPLDLVLILRDGRWPRRSERTARAMRGPLVSARQRIGNGLPSSAYFRNREGVYS